MEALLFCALILIFFLLAKNFLKPNGKLPPSPPYCLPLIGHLHLFKKPLHRAFADISSCHGPVLLLRLGSRSIVLVSSPDAAEECFTRNDLVFANRPRLLAGKHLGYNYTSLVWASYGNHWRNLKRIASSEILSSHRLQDLYTIRKEEIRSLVGRLLRGIGRKGYQVAGMKTMFSELTYNAMMRMIAGKTYYGDALLEESREEARKFKEIVTETFQVSGATNIVDFLPALKWIGLNKTEKQLVMLQEKRDRFLQDLIDGHRRSRKNSSSLEPGSRTMIDVLLSLQETDPEHYRDEIIRGIIQVMLSAGTDTTAITMEWALSLLLNNPEVLIKAQSEIDSYTDQTRLLEESDLPNLPYLQNIVNETLRMYPAAPLIPPHESSEECTVGGYCIPCRTMLLVNAWAIHNDPKHWEQPRRFMPERFEFEGSCRDGEGIRFLPFGAGRRGCPGESLATKMVGLTLGTLVQCFEWKRVGKEMVDMSEGHGLAMPKVEPLVAEYRPREAAMHLLSLSALI